MTDLSRCCVKCKNQRNCAYLVPFYTGFYCPGMEAIINNNKDLREPLLSDLNEDLTVDNINARDYKQVLSEMRDLLTTEKVKKFTQIRNMPVGNRKETIKKGIACLLWFEIKPTQIAQILNISVQWFYRIVKK